MRLDALLVDRKICSSREKARYLIQRGGVKINGKPNSKPSFAADKTDTVEFDRDEAIPYVSKGGLKLEKAISYFSLNFKGKTVLDIGASTCGFTDSALRHGAKFVWAADVGSNQLHSDLKNDNRIQSHENTDFRTLKLETVGQKVDIVIGDLSFISLTLILNCIPKFIADNSLAVLLIKPQFEAGPENLGKGGIVKNPKVHQKVIQNIILSAQKNGLYLSGLTFAPIMDIKKNIEYLAIFNTNRSTGIDFVAVVENSFLEKGDFKGIK